MSAKPMLNVSVAIAPTASGTSVPSGSRASRRRPAP